MQLVKIWAAYQHDKWHVYANVNTEAGMEIYKIHTTGCENHAEFMVNELTNNSYLDPVSRRILTRLKLGGYILNNKIV